QQPVLAAVFARRTPTDEFFERALGELRGDVTLARIRCDLLFGRAIEIGERRADDVHPALTSASLATFGRALARHAHRFGVEPRSFEILVVTHPASFGL